jgi:hypothetical protein
LIYLTGRSAYHASVGVFPGQYTTGRLSDSAGLASISRPGQPISRLIDQLRKIVRAPGHGEQTVAAIADWAVRFILHHGKRRSLLFIVLPRFRLGDGLEQLFDHVFGADPFGLGPEVGAPSPNVLFGLRTLCVVDPLLSKGVTFRGQPRDTALPDLPETDQPSL